MVLAGLFSRTALSIAVNDPTAVQFAGLAVDQMRVTH